MEMGENGLNDHARGTETGENGQVRWRHTAWTWWARTADRAMAAAALAMAGRPADGRPAAS